MYRKRWIFERFLQPIHVRNKTRMLKPAHDTVHVIGLEIRARTTKHVMTTARSVRFGRVVRLLEVEPKLLFDHEIVDPVVDDAVCDAEVCIPRINPTIHIVISRYEVCQGYKLSCCGIEFDA